MAAKRRSRAFWSEHVQAWKASGETSKAYAKRLGVKASTLSWWAWKLGADGALVEVDASLPFVELMPVVIDGRLELEVGGVTVRVPNEFDAEVLGRVLDVLRSR